MELLDLRFFNGVSGKVGDYIYYQLNGKTVVRRRPRKSSKKPSPRQVYQRKAFAAAQRFLHPIKEELAFTHTGQTDSLRKGIHLVTGQVLHQAISNRAGLPVLEPLQVLISRGPVEGLLDASLEKIGESQFRLSWNANTWIGTPSEGDRLYLLVYCPDEKLFFAIREGAYRKSAMQEFEIPWLQKVQSKTYCYAAFYKKVPKGIRFSDSVCLEVD